MVDYIFMLGGVYQTCPSFRVPHDAYVVATLLASPWDYPWLIADNMSALSIVDEPSTYGLTFGWLAADCH
jgi:hypothetical protein